MKGKWKFKDPNRKSNYHKFDKIVSRHDLARARQEAYDRFKKQGDSPHVALVKCLNSVGVREHSQNQKNRG